MSPRTRKILGRAIPIAFYVLLAFFLIRYIAGIDWGQLAKAQLNWWLLVVATLLSLGFRYWGVMIWFFLLRRLGAGSLRGKQIALAHVYAKSWLGRYIPGAATWIVGKVYFASKLGVSRARLGVSGLLEGALQIAATLALGLLLLLIDPRTNALDVTYRIGMFVAFVLCVVALIPPVFEFLVNLALRIIRRKPLDKAMFPTTSTMALSALFYLGGSIIAGISYYFIAASIYPGLQSNDILFVIGATSLASAASMIAIFAPGGLGVRELILGVLLSVVMPAEIAALIVVFTRVWSIAVDALFFGTTALTSIIASRMGKVEDLETSDEVV
ncbi:MAG TPA: lysylphosphatidylglycerol synthase domain-containing protein [Galbitalea sp.]|jgi:uncharacterized membrane protein YbhN (UPF0104 family)